MKPKIYLYCVALGTGSGNVRGSSFGGDVLGYALAENGYCLASHLSSSVEFSRHDMGYESNWKHDLYDRYYPDGYELVWIDESDLDNHEGWKKAFELNRELNNGS